MRLWAMAPFVPFVPLGALLFGVALERGWSWWVVAVGNAVCQFGVTPISSLALTYVTDSYADVSFLLQLSMNSPQDSEVNPNQTCLLTCV